MAFRKRIVVVDDDPKVRQLLEHVLVPPEFESFLFASGSEALRRLPEIRPDCVVSDILMPAMDGETLLRSARDTAGFEQLPFIIISALRSEGRIRSVLDAGATRFIQKPFPLRQLLDEIRALTGTEPAATPAPPAVIPFPAPAAAPPVAAFPPASPTPSLLGARAAVAAPSALPSPPPSGPRRVELAPPPALVGYGRFTRVEWEQRTFLVLTEHVTRPHFKITTLVSENGADLARVQSVLACALARKEDGGAVRQQVELQHEGVLQRIASIAAIGAPRRMLWPDHRRSIDSGLLAWAVSAVAQRAEAHLGQEATARLLRSTRQRVGADAFESLEVTAFGRVVVDLAHGTRLPRTAVQAVSRWCAAFAADALQLDPERAAELVREATRYRASELEILGFYDKLA